MLLTTPRAHQDAADTAAADKSAFALFMEQGTGKTFVTLRRALRLSEQQRIDALVIIAPKGVHRTWIEIELPKHIAPSITFSMWWSASMGKRKRREWDALKARTSGFRVFSLNIEAMSLAVGKKELRSLLDSRRCLLVVDESTKIKNPNALRTKGLIALARHKGALGRMILTGTPITRSPLDLYAQTQFLKKGLLGCVNYTVFKAFYAEWRKRVDAKTGKSWEEVTSFKNLDILRERLAPYAFFIKKSECLDLPPKEYVFRGVEMSPESAARYEQVCEQALIELGEEEFFTIPNALARLTRLQQIAGGFDPATGEWMSDHKIDSLRDWIEDIDPDTKIIIWARFIPELRRICEMLAEEFPGQGIVRWWGEIAKSEQESCEREFQTNPAVRFFVANVTSNAVYGITMTKGTQVAYFSNSFMAEARWQSEDRPHRIGQDNIVTYTDFVCFGTKDMRVAEVLKQRKDVADVLTKDDIKEWFVSESAKNFQMNRGEEVLG